MKVPRAAILGSICLLQPLALAQTRLRNGPEPEARSQVRESSWDFVEDFSHGIRGWMSFPLAEDIGYDPSLYTTSRDGHFCLVRDVVAEGQSKLRIGVLRSIHLRLLPQSSIQLRYRIEASGRHGPTQFFAAAVSGKQYVAAIPSSSGEHVVTLRGGALGVSASGEDIEALVLQTIAVDPIRSTHNRLVLESMKIEDARRRSSITINSPALDAPAGGGTPVANTIVRSDTPVLPIRMEAVDHSARLDLFNGDGREVRKDLPADGQIHLGRSPSPGLWRARLSAGGAESDFRFLVMGKVPPHPRLLLTPERLEQLRSDMPSDALGKMVQERAVLAGSQLSANAGAGNNILRMSSDSLFPGLPQYFQLLDRYGDAIELNALDFRLSGSEKSLQTARAALLAAAHWPTWTPPWFPTHGLQSYYEAGIFAQKAALGYDLIADQLSAAEKKEIADGFYRNAVYPVVADYFNNDRMPLADSNHMAHSLGGAIAACMAVYGDVPAWETRFGPALAKLIAAYEHLLIDMFPSDGSEAEPVGYQEFAMEGLSIGAAALARAGIRPQGTDRMLQSFWWPYYAQYKPGYELDTGDELGTLFAHSGFAWATQISSDPALRAFYLSAPTRTLAAFFHLGRQPAVLSDMLDLACCTTPIGPVPVLPPSRIFPDRGSAALRSGWGADSTLVSIRVGPWFNHGHYDEGSFQVASGGEVLIGEAGYAEYYSDPRFADYFTQAAGHNTVLVDHNPFSQDALGTSRWKAFANYPRFTHDLLGDGMDFLEANLQPAYPDADLIQYGRQYLFLKPDLLFVHDRIASSTAHAYSFLLHPGDDTEPILNGASALLHGSHTTALVVATPGEGPWQRKPAPLPTIAYTDFDKSVIHARSTLHLESPPVRDDSFSVGIQILPSAAQGTLRSFSSHNAEGFSAEDGRVQVLFRKSMGELTLAPYASDGDILATITTSAGQRVFTAKAQWMRDGGQSIFSATQPIDAEETHTAGHERWRIFCSHPASVRMPVSDSIKSATADGSAVQLPTDKHSVQLNLQPGEHLVDLLY